LVPCALRAPAPVNSGVRQHHTTSSTYTAETQKWQNQASI
jgi:hypothetical protein